MPPPSIGQNNAFQQVTLHPICSKNETKSFNKSTKKKIQNFSLKTFEFEEKTKKHK